MVTRQSTLSSVEYRDIVNFPGYRVGNDGSVWTCWKRTRGNGNVYQITLRWKQLKPGVTTKKYRQVTLRPGSGKKKKIFYVHRLVLEAFVGPCPENMECRHLNGVRSDCRLDNLAWGTKAENEADKKKHANYGSRARLYVHEGRALSIAEWARVFEISYTTFYMRIFRYGMTFEEAVRPRYRNGKVPNGKHCS